MKQDDTLTTGDVEPIRSIRLALRNQRHWARRTAQATGCLILLAGASSAQTTWFVSQSGTPAGTGTAANPYQQIQTAIDAPTTLSGDDIQVAAGDTGLFPPYGPINFGGKALDIIGTDFLGLGPGISSALNGSCVTFPGSAVLPGEQTLTNFRISAGSANFGGGIFITSTSPTIRDVWVIGCSASFGGGAACTNSNAVFEDCLFLSNQTVLSAGPKRGGAVWLNDSGATFRNVEIRANLSLENSLGISGHGGGIWITGDNPDGNSNLFEDCLIDSNIAANGGGVWIEGGSTSTFNRCRIRSNSATAGTDAFVDGNGGGVFVTASCPSLTNCVISSNEARTSSTGILPVSGSGGGIFFEDSIGGNPAAPCGGSVMENCTVAWNFAGNVQGIGDNGGRGGGMYNESSPVRIDRSIFWFNDVIPVPSTNVREGPQMAILDPGNNGGLFVTGDYIALERGVAMIFPPSNPFQSFMLQNTANPQFTGSFESTRLSATSPLIDALPPGFTPPIGSLDIDGEPRLVGSTVDYGADEWIGPGSITEYGTPNLNSAGTRTRLRIFGSTSISANSMTYRVTDGPRDAFGLIFYAPRQVSFSPMGSSGIVFAGGTLVRAGGTVLTSAGTTNNPATGGTDLPIDLTRPVFAPIVPGSIWNFQFFHRDSVGGMDTTNYSNGVNIFFDV